MLKRKRTQISYRESSPDEGNGDSSSDSSGEEVASASTRTPRRRVVRTAPKRPQQASSARAARTDRTLRRPDRNRVSYKEPSSDIEVDEEPGNVEEQANARRERHAKRARVFTGTITQPEVSPVKTPSKTPRKTKGAGKDRKFARVLVKHAKKQESSTPIISDGVMPQWIQLPYHVLLQVFVYASHPLSENSSWLLNAAKLHRNLCEPALTALYRCPPVSTLTKGQHAKFMSTLLEPPEGRLYNYNVKVRRLELNSTNMLSYTSPTGGLFDLPELVKKLPQVGDIEIYDPEDIPPYRKRTKAARWHYPDAFFSSLEEANIHLRSWKWNSALFWKQHPVVWMGQIHQTPPFQTVSNLSLCNYHPEEKRPTEGEELQTPSRGEALASTLALLPSLKSLTFETCGIADEKFLPLLPNTLSSLNITNCIYLDAETLRSFLQSHGATMKDLTLNHNQSLNLSFLSQLKESCPTLQGLTMDLNYYSTFTTSNDADPKYDTLLDPKEVPTWPSTMQHLEMLYLRKWTTEATEIFFSSIVDSADQLPDLRALIIKATGILDISWRDRARLRDEWVARLRRVFLARHKPPNPQLVSMRAYRERNTPSSTTRVPVKKAPTESALSRQLSHVQVTPNKTREEGIAGKPSARRSLRQHVTVPGGLKEDSSVEEDGDSDSDSESVDDSEEIFIQGLCTTVDISIDNLRPREEIFHEEDFLDAEISGDEDWNENNDDADEPPAYAW